VPAVVLFANRSLFPRHHRQREGTSGRRVGDLIGNVPLRRALIAAAIIETGAGALHFYLPIYAHGRGFSLRRSASSWARSRPRCSTCVC